MSNKINYYSKILISKFNFLIIPILAIIIFENMLSLEIKTYFYTISLIVKHILLFFAPLIIFIFIASAIISLKEQALKFTFLLLIFVTLSNFIGVISGYIIGINIIPLIKMPYFFDTSDFIVSEKSIMIIKLFPPLITTQTAMYLGIFIGIILTCFQKDSVSQYILKARNGIITFFRKYFSLILPIFIFGSLCSIQYEKFMHKLLISYGQVILLFIMVQFLYIFIFYLIASKFKISLCLIYIKNMIPALITAFFTMSSTATLPHTITCTEKNHLDKNFTQIILPIVCNMHNIGSAVGIPILVLAIMQSFNLTLPNDFQFFNFAIHYTLAKYAVAGIPGGIIITIIPLLEHYLHFTSEMISVITTIYCLLDSFGTVSNVACNGAFSIFFKKIYDLFPNKIKS